MLHIRMYGVPTTRLRIRLYQVVGAGISGHVVPLLLLVLFRLPPFEQAAWVCQYSTRGTPQVCCRLRHLTGGGERILEGDRERERDAVRRGEGSVWWHGISSLSSLFCSTDSVP
jgi:hypothetical protein